jgi:hypothetical protein
MCLLAGFFAVIKLALVTKCDCQRGVSTGGSADPIPDREMTMKLLHVDSSILGAGSVSRQLSEEIVAAERRLHPAAEVVYRDLASTPVAHLSGAHLAARSGVVPETAEAQADIATGDAMLDEFLAADMSSSARPCTISAFPASSRHGSIASPLPARPSAIRKEAPRAWRPASV